MIFAILVLLGFGTFIRYQLSTPESIFFPNIKTPEGIYKACRLSSYSQAVLTLIFILFSCPMYFNTYAVVGNFTISALLIFFIVAYSLLAIFSFKLSRVANTLALVIYLLNWIFILKGNSESLNFHILYLFGIFVFCFGWPIFQGVRASFAYPGLKKQYLEDNIPLPSPPKPLTGILTKLFPMISAPEQAHKICTSTAGIMTLYALLVLANKILYLLNEPMKAKREIPFLILGLGYLIFGDLIKKRIKGAALFLLLFLILEALYGIFFFKDPLITNLFRLVFLSIMFPRLINSHRASSKTLDVPKPLIEDDKAKLNSNRMTIKPTSILSVLYLHLPKYLIIILFITVLSLLMMIVAIKIWI